MGRDIATVNYPGLEGDQAIGLVTAVLGDAGWRIGASGPRAEEVASVSVGGWATVHLPSHFYKPLQERLIAASDDRGVYLFTADSDIWGATLFRDGTVERRFDTGSRLPAPKALRKQLAVTLAIDVPEAELARVLAMRPTYAEEAMDAFAQLLGIDAALELPDADVTRVLVEPPQSAAEAALASRLDLRAEATIEPQGSGFGSAATDLLRLLCDRVGGGKLGYRNVLAGSDRRGGLEVSEFEERDLPLIAARLDAGELESVDSNFEGVRFSCQRQGTRGRHIQVVFDEALSVDGEVTRPEASLALEPGTPLVPALFGATGAYHGFIEPVSASPETMQHELVAVRGWPPVATWTTYLGADLGDELGGADAVVTAAGPGWESSRLAGGGLLLRLKLSPHEARGPEAEKARAALTKVLAAAPLP